MTKNEKIRLAEIERHTANRAHDNGAMGRAFELSCARVRSGKTRVSKQGEADVAEEEAAPAEEVAADAE